MPASVKLQREYGDALQVIFVESQGASEKKMEGFALRRKWLGTNAMWTTERPCNDGINGLPSFVLLGADGRVLEKGHHASSDTKDLIDGEVAAGRGGPSDVPKALRGAWMSFQRGDVAKAIDAAAKAGTKEELADAAATTIERFRFLIGARLDRVAWCIDNGFLVDADARLDALRGGVKGLDEFAARVAELDGRLAAPEMRREMDASKTLERIVARLHEEGFGKRDKNRKSLEKIAKQFPDTAAAARALRLLEL